MVDGQFRVDAADAAAGLVYWDMIIMQSNEKTMMYSGTSMKSSIPGGQEEKKISLNRIKTLQAKVNENQLISVTYFHPKIAKEGERKYQQRMQLVLK